MSEQYIVNQKINAVFDGRPSDPCSFLCILIYNRDIYLFERGDFAVLGTK